MGRMEGSSLSLGALGFHPHSAVVLLWCTEESYWCTCTQQYVDQYTCILLHVYGYTTCSSLSYYQLHSAQNTALQEIQCTSDLRESDSGDS